jgi:hypothetical protein
MSALAGLALAIGAAQVTARVEAGPLQATQAVAFADDFDLTACTFTTRGQNPYFILEPGFQLVLGGDPERRRHRDAHRRGT